MTASKPKNSNKPTNHEPSTKSNSADAVEKDTFNAILQDMDKMLELIFSEKQFSARASKLYTALRYGWHSHIAPPSALSSE